MTEELDPTQCLTPEVAKKYRVSGIEHTAFQQWPWGDIDFRYLDLKRADDLVKRGFPYLVPAEKKTKTRP
jgi:hypothetical protein